MKDLDNQTPSLRTNVLKKHRDQAQLEKDKLDIAMDACHFPLMDLTLTDECEYKDFDCNEDDSLDHGAWLN